MSDVGETVGLCRVDLDLILERAQIREKRIESCLKSLLLDIESQRDDLEMVEILAGRLKAYTVPAGEVEPGVLINIPYERMAAGLAELDILNTIDRDEDAANLSQYIELPRVE